MRAFLLLVLSLPLALCAEPVKRYVTLDGTRLLTKPAVVGGVGPGVKG